MSLKQTPTVEKLMNIWEVFLGTGAPDFRYLVGGGEER